MIKILLTGSSGFIGQAFLRRFARYKDLALYGVGRRAIASLLRSVSYRQLEFVDSCDLNFTPYTVIHAVGKAGAMGKERRPMPSLK